MSGSISFPPNPTDGQLYTFQGHTWQWRASPPPGAWVNASTGANFVAITGSTMTGPLVLSGPGAAPLNPATVAQSADNVGRNLLHNGLANINQRGGPWSASGYTLDRWIVVLSGGDTGNVSQATLADTDRAQIGDEAAIRAINFGWTGTSAAAAFSLYQQPIENVRRLAGKTVTASFWAVANHVLNLGMSIDQFFGSGGSPSAQVNGNGQSVSVGTAWQRYSMSFALPSSTGKTLGTNNNDATYLSVWGSSGTTNATRAGNIGVQTGAVFLWGLQLEIGSVATPLEKLDPQQDLANCRRFYQSGSTWVLTAYGNAGGAAQMSNSLSPAMRAAPTAVITNNSSSNITGANVNTSIGSAWLNGNVVSTGQFSLVANISLSADL